MHKVLQEQVVQTRFQAKISGIKLHEVQSMRKNLDTNRKPEKNNMAMP